MTSPTQQNPGDEETTRSSGRSAVGRRRIPGILLRVVLALWLIAILGPLAVIGALASGWQPDPELLNYFENHPVVQTYRREMKCLSECSITLDRRADV